ncbi:MAG: putative sugar nucleotidyl transferase, partial [Conexivisphaera sp.]
MRGALALFQEEYPDPLSPLSLTTPVLELRYGVRQIYRAIVDAAGEPEVLIAPPRFRLYLRERYPGKATEPEDVRGRLTLLNMRVRPGMIPEVLRVLESEGRPVVDGGKLVAAEVSAEDLRVEDVLRGYWAGIEMDALMKGPWELVEALRSWGGGSGVVYGSNVRIEEPVVIDASRGPVLIADDVRIEAFSRIEGPAYVGRGTVVHSARINPHTYVGEMCRVGGEVEGSIIAGYSNKAHFGYLGHSYVGQWVNIGAGSVTSDLKNTYGTVRAGRARADTGLVKLGSFIGDHAKLAIGTLVYAGKSIGGSSHVYGLVGVDVPPFTIYSSSGAPGTSELALEKALEVASRMMSR